MSNLIETINGEQIYSLINSSGFLERIDDVARKTEETGKEHGFDVMKRIRGPRFSFSEIAVGEEDRFYGPNYNMQEGEYCVVTLHSHPARPKATFELASINDIVLLQFYSVANSYRSQINTKPIGIILSHHEQHDFKVILSPYQEKRPIDATYWFDEEGMSDDEFFAAYALVLNNLNLGGIFYDPETKKFDEQARYDWKVDKQRDLHIKELLEKFSFDVTHSNG